MKLYCCVFGLLLFFWRSYLINGALITGFGLYTHYLEMERRNLVKSKACISK